MSLADRLLAAHEDGDGVTLARLYTEAAENAQQNAAAFYLTHAWVFALEAGDPAAAEIEARLKAMGRA